jgi:hypothetical protein
MDTLQLQTQRVDVISSKIVDRGIKVQLGFGTLCALEYLKSHNVDPQVIERVLSNPEQRRQYIH